MAQDSAENGLVDTSSLMQMSRSSSSTAENGSSERQEEAPIKNGLLHFARSTQRREEQKQSGHRFIEKEVGAWTWIEGLWSSRQLEAAPGKEVKPAEAKKERNQSGKSQACRCSEPNRSDEQHRRNIAALAIDPVATCLLYTSPSPRDRTRSRMPSSA